MGCEVSEESGTLLRGKLDTVNMPDSTAYGVAVLLRNSLFARPGPVAADPNGVFITDLVVEVNTFAGERVGFTGANPFTTPASIFIPSGDPETPGAAIGDFRLLPSAYVDELRGTAPTTLVFEVEMHGHTAGGTDVSVGPWRWVVDTCEGCLIACSTEGEEALTCPVENILQIVQCTP
jgi:hypothetical protein